jgi:hypothetical protein
MTTSDLTITPSPDSPAVPLTLRYFDVVLVLALAPVVFLAGLPALGYVVGAAAWIVGRALGVWLDHRVANAQDARVAAFTQLAGVMGRALLIGITILAVGKAGDRKDGLMAAVLVLIAFTVYLAISLILQPQRKPSK